MKQYKTSKLFYGKYPYKIETDILGWDIKTLGVARIIAECNNPRGRYKSRCEDFRKDLLEYITIAEEFINSDIKTRAEGNILNYFLEDRNTYDSMCKKLAPWIVSVTAPASDNDLEILQSDTQQVLCNVLPYEKYQFKITLRENTPIEIRLKFSKWLENYQDRVKVSNTTRYWLQGYKNFSQNPFLYIDDYKQLSLTLLFLGNYVKKKQEYVLRDTQINSVSEDKECQH